MGFRKVLIELVPPRGTAFNIGDARAYLQKFDFKMDVEYESVSMPAMKELGFTLVDFLAGTADTYVIRGEVDESRIAEIRAQPNVVEIWDDALVAPFPVDCDPNIAKSDIDGVVAYLKVDAIWKTGCDGSGIKIGIVDNGIDGNDHRLQFAGDGWAPPGQPKPGQGSRGSHGSMCAFDAVSVCRAAQTYDIRVLSANDVPTLISDALRGFQWAIDHYRRDGTPQVLSNSWGMYQEAWGPNNYSRDPKHPFTRKAIEAARRGIVVTFAAGNCGSLCPDPRCASDVGPGASIWGANSHPEMITFGAVNLREEWIGYSSQGPGAISPFKPDVCGLSHFKGYRQVDSGTSAANPIGAGLLGLMISKASTQGRHLSQSRALSILQLSAKDILSPGWDCWSGYGVIQGKAAWDLV